MGGGHRRVVLAQKEQVKKIRRGQGYRVPAKSYGCGLAVLQRQAFFSFWCLDNLA